MATKGEKVSGALHLISGLPRSGSTFLCNVLNMNPGFRATATSPLVEALIQLQAVFSHTVGFKATDRMSEYNDYANAMRAFIETYRRTTERVVFDKNRNWPNHLDLLDHVMNHRDTKIVWTYRDPVQVFLSIEKQHRKTLLLQFAEAQQVKMNDLVDRVTHFIGPNGIISSPVQALFNAHERGFEDRIHIVDYKKFCKAPQSELDKVHEFLGIEKFKYDGQKFEDLVQSTHEYDNLWNYKYRHDIQAGKIEYSEIDPEEELDIPKRYIEQIEKNFEWLYNLMKEEKKEDKKKDRLGLRKA